MINIFKNKKTRALILIMCALVLSGVIISYFYYRDINDSIDPRILAARTLYDRYNEYASLNQLDSVFILMDSIEAIYAATDHYRNSYEIGVLHNNRAASYLTMALYPVDSGNITRKQDSLINFAEDAVYRSIEIYNQWIKVFDNKSEEEIKELISDEFLTGLGAYNDDQKNKFLNSRIKEIKESQVETGRRLSVSYTNLGIIFRHRLQYDSAAMYYKKALDLWDRNLTAENNLNILLGKPLKKRNFIQKLFPPDRNK